MSTDQVKRLWFTTGEDAYFVTYNILVLLRTLGYGPSRPFRDHRKFAFLVDFVADPALASLVTGNTPGRLTERDQERLSAAFMRGVQRLPMTSRLVVALARREILLISNKRGQAFLDVSHQSTEQVNRFLRSSMFEQERKNVAAIKSMRLGMVTYETLLDRLFYSHGVAQWAV